MAGILNIQFKPILKNKQANLEKIEHYIKQHIEQNKDKKLDLVIFPEFFSTGIDNNAFINEPEDEQTSETITFIKNLAVKYNTNIIAGTVIEKCEDRLYNTSFAIDRKGNTIAKYRKIHLYNFLGGNEGETITAGDELIIADFDFAKVGLSICFDIRYPLQFKKLTKMGAQIIVLPTAWIVPTEVYTNYDALKFAQDTWIAMNRIRAYDNYVHIITSNQTGQVNSYMGAIGTSLIISATSEVLANAKDNECTIWADVDIDIVKQYKAIFPIANID